MISGTNVPFRKRLVLSLLVPIFLIGWAIVPMNANANIQQALNIAPDGTVYQYLCYDGQPAGTNHLRVTNISMGIGFSPTSASVQGTATTGATLVARVPATPIVALAQAKRSGILNVPSCPPDPVAIPFSSSGAGSWTLGGTTFSGFADTDLTLIGSASPSASIFANGTCDPFNVGDVYGFGGAASCSDTQFTTEPSDGFSLTVNQGVLFVYNGASFIPPNTAGTLNVAGGGAGFDVIGVAPNTSTNDATADSDTRNVAVTTTTTTTTTTTSTTTTTTTPPKIPTAGNRGMIMLGLAFLGAIAWMLRARRSLR